MIEYISSAIKAIGKLISETNQINYCLGLKAFGECSSYMTEEYSIFNLGAFLGVFGILFTLYQLITPNIKLRLEFYNIERWIRLLIGLSLIANLIGFLIHYIPLKSILIIGYPIFWEFLSAILIILIILLVINYSFKEIKNVKNFKVLYNVLNNHIYSGEKYQAAIADEMQFFILELLNKNLYFKNDDNINNILEILMYKNLSDIAVKDIGLIKLIFNTDNKSPTQSQKKFIKHYFFNSINKTDSFISTYISSNINGTNQNFKLINNIININLIVNFEILALDFAFWKSIVNINNNNTFYDNIEIILEELCEEIEKYFNQNVILNKDTLRCYKKWKDKFFIFMIGYFYFNGKILINKIKNNQYYIYSKFYGDFTKYLNIIYNDEFDFNKLFNNDIAISLENIPTYEEATFGHYYTNVRKTNNFKALLISDIIEIFKNIHLIKETSENSRIIRSNLIFLGNSHYLIDDNIEKNEDITETLNLFFKAYKNCFTIPYGKNIYLIKPFLYIYGEFAFTTNILSLSGNVLSSHLKKIFNKLNLLLKNVCEKKVRVNNKIINIEEILPIGFEYNFKENLLSFTYNSNIYNLNLLGKSYKIDVITQM